MLRTICQMTWGECFAPPRRVLRTTEESAWHMAKCHNERLERHPHNYRIGNRNHEAPKLRQLRAQSVQAEI